jgi:hypothetical protein
LPKGQDKALETTMFLPTSEQGAHVDIQIRARKGRGFLETREPLRPMPSYQYHFVVLARLPDQYRFLDDRESIKPQEGLMGQNVEAFYRVHTLKVQEGVPLPLYGLLWTGIAYVLWDDAPPDALSSDQQQAMLDWLHWGGQLIISGPDTLETLRGSFLGPFLPADAGEARELTEDDLRPLSDYWTIPDQDGKREGLRPVRPWSAVTMNERSEARFVPGTGGLLAERRVGRGRVVVSAFRLSNRELRDWPSFDGFLNACLLRRPPRTFAMDYEAQVQPRWADDATHWLDARRITQVRYFSRDTGVSFDRYAADVRYTSDPLGDWNESRPAAPGVAAWNDFSAVAHAAREALRHSARVEIPKRSFVGWVVAAYLAVLVPLNWAVFRLLGRVEWAWAAVPVLAVVCTAVVIRQARLNIGFQRSRTELALIELQGDYPRAHVTRYSALYTSLSTPYTLRSDDPGAQLLPFSKVAKVEEFRMLRGASRSTLAIDRSAGVSLSGMVVSSNTTDLAHSEQMCDLGGPIDFQETSTGECRIVNRTDYTLHDVGVMRRSAWGVFETAWLGTLEPGQAASQPFTAEDPRAHGRRGPLWEFQREQTVLTRSQPEPGQLHFGGVLALAQDHTGLGGGDVRLVAWTDEEIPGLQIEPEAGRKQFAALVVAHLRYGPGEEPRRDENTRQSAEKPPAFEFDPRRYEDRY